ncbi:hypothetical protein Q4543_23040 [Salipiger sp. 1_MG-2023]|uniref:hypothetical protein n=1 Tax=Salipiger sp. 1_MG-2023 TaxID=3062665 RepID=UPI0026E185D0|nr:hypothetical protein [Salipiger sp. 1_MG-2023]MDO6588370.1 hypothetical protein [Salipiger sp. 1_MG-2023]
MFWLFRRIVLIVALCAGFAGGRIYERFVYKDLCIEMGGGQIAGNRPICVVPAPR